MRMGGKVDTFLSNQVTHVVTSSKPTASPCLTGRESTVGAGQTSEPVALSRGLALLKLSGRTQSPAGGKSGVAARAKQLGVSVITVSDIVDQIKRHIGTSAELAHGPPIIVHERGKPVVKQLRGVFMKIEDDGRKFRPIMQRFQSFPAVAADSTHATSPFLNNQHFTPVLKKTESTRCSSQSVTLPSTKVAEKKTFRKDGFCECCDSYFEDMNLHRRSEKHKQYASCDENYASLDTVISQCSPIENLLASFHAATPVLDCLRNTTCHAGMSSLTLCDDSIYPIRLTERDRAVTEDNNDNNNNNTNNTKSLHMFPSKHSPSNDYFVANCADETERTLSQSVTLHSVSKTECANPNVIREIRNVVRSMCEATPNVKQGDPVGCSKTYGDYVNDALYPGNNTDKISQEVLDKGQVHPANGNVQHEPVEIPCDRSSEQKAAIWAADHGQHVTLMQYDQVNNSMFGGYWNTLTPNVSNITSVERTSLSDKETQRQRIECDVTDKPRARLYDDRSETRNTKRDNDADGFGVISRIACQENTDPSTCDYRSCVVTNDASLTDLTASDVDICRMLDANIAAPLTQLIPDVDTTVPSCDIELNDCAVLSSLTQLLDIADDCQTIRLDGSRLTDYLNESGTSDVDVVTVDSDVLDREQSVAHTLRASCGNDSRAMSSLEERMTTTATKAKQCADTANNGHRYGVQKECASPTVGQFPTGAPSESNMANFDIVKSKRIPYCDSEPVNTDITSHVYSDDARWQSHCTNDLALKFRRTTSRRQVCLSPLTATKHSSRRSKSSTGGDICEIVLATHVGTTYSTESVALTTKPTNERCSVLPKTMHNSVSALLLAPMPMSSPHACELHNMPPVTEKHWTVTPSGDTSVRLRRTNEVTWSVEKSGDCSLRFSVNKQRIASQSDADCNVTSVSRKTTKRRKLF